MIWRKLVDIIILLTAGIILLLVSSVYIGLTALTGFIWLIGQLFIN